MNNDSKRYTGRGGRHLFPDRQEKKVQAAGPLIREILENTGHIGKPDRIARSRNADNSESRDDLDKGEAPKIISVLLADDHAIVREGLAAVINAQPEMQVIAQASDGQEAVDKFRTLHPDVALIDLRMPVMDGIETISTICGDDPKAKVVVLTTYQDEEDVYRVLQAGARGYILKSGLIADLIGCISAVAKGATWIPPQVGAMLARRVSAPELTKREKEVLQSMANGKSNKEIGVALDISEGTVKVHMTHILEKLKVTGRTEAIGVAVRRGLVRIDSTAA